MTVLHQVRCPWTSNVGIDGVSTFYCTGSVANFRTRLITFWNAMKTFIPDEVTITVPAVGNDIEDTTGQVVATWANGAASPVVCTGSGNYAAGAGGVINWRTGLFVGGRELRGKTFLVPIISGAFGTSGVLDPGIITAANTAASNLIGGTDPMVVYSPTQNTNGVVTSGAMPTKGMLLGSRRA